MALYLEQTAGGECRISLRLPQWRELVGIGATPSKAAGHFEIQLKTAYPSPGAYDGPAWNGIKAEKPAPPKPAGIPTTTKADSPAEPKAAAAATATKSTVPGPTSPAAESPGIPTEEGSTNPA